MILLVISVRPKFVNENGNFWPKCEVKYQKFTIGNELFLIVYLTFRSKSPIYRGHTAKRRPPQELQGNLKANYWGWQQNISLQFLSIGSLTNKHVKNQQSTVLKDRRCTRVRSWRGRFSYFRDLLTATPSTSRSQLCPFSPPRHFPPE